MARQRLRSKVDVQSGRARSSRTYAVCAVTMLLCPVVLDIPPVQAQSSAAQNVWETFNLKGSPQPRTAPSCLGEIGKAEERYKLPSGLLLSVALVESGRHDPSNGTVAPWPWTLNARGIGHFYDSVEEAARETGKYLDKNDGILDVGCMQVDLYHHPHAFPTLLAAFDPKTNVDYAAQYLTSLYKTNGSWSAAVAAYHAGNPAGGSDYLARVLYYWRTKGLTLDKAKGMTDSSTRPGFVLDQAPHALDLVAEFYVAKDYEAAQVLYQGVLENNPDDVIALLGAAECARQLGKDEVARDYLERALTAKPDDRLPLEALIRLIDASPPEKRLLRLLTARKVAPQAPEIPARIAVIEASLGQLPQAVEDMAAAVRLSPNDPIILLNYALLLDRSGQERDALIAYRAFLRLYRPGAVALTIPLERVREREIYLESHAR